MSWIPSISYSVFSLLPFSVTATRSNNSRLLFPWCKPKDNNDTEDDEDQCAMMMKQLIKITRLMLIIKNDDVPDRFNRSLFFFSFHCFICWYVTQRGVGGGVQN